MTSLGQFEVRRPLMVRRARVVEPYLDVQAMRPAPLVDDVLDSPGRCAGEVDVFPPTRERGANREEARPAPPRRGTRCVFMVDAIAGDDLDIAAVRALLGMKGHFSLNECLQVLEHGGEEKLTPRFHRCQLAVSTPHGGVARRSVGAARARGRRLPASVECGQLTRIRGLQLPRQPGCHPP